VINNQALSVALHSGEIRALQGGNYFVQVTRGRWPITYSAQNGSRIAGGKERNAEKGVRRNMKIEGTTVARV